MSPANSCDPVDSYVRPIRSVLFIDDQFPTFAEDSDAAFGETQRARALWRMCTELGWLCDIDNSADWTSSQRKQRLAACDLLVLDYHLSGSDSGPALSIIRDLARSETPNLVVIYTADSSLDKVLISVAASARGASATKLALELEPEIEEIKVEWTREDLLAFFCGSRKWMRTYQEACNAAGQPASLIQGEALLEKWIVTEYGAQPSDRTLNIEKIKCSASRWFQCGNLFLVVIGKPAEQMPEQETRAVLDGLEAAVKDWAPSWLACLVASSRRNIELGAFRDDIILPLPPLQVGLLRYVQASEDGEERKRRAREIASHLLAQRFEYAANIMSEELTLRAEAASGETPATADDQVQLLHLNAFLCSESVSRHHLRLGTIVREEDTGMYWVCVTPACDMVPRTPVESINPWAAALDPLRPLLALRLEIRRGQEIADALAKAERGRHVFFWDNTLSLSAPITAACFNTVTDDPNPRLEQMFALDRARITNGNVTLQRCVRASAGETIISKNVSCIVISQLRAPYAERLAHMVGAHLSRIGVNFLQAVAVPITDQSRGSS